MLHWEDLVGSADDRDIGLGADDVMDLDGVVVAASVQEQDSEPMAHCSSPFMIRTDALLFFLPAKVVGNFKPTRLTWALRTHQLQRGPKFAWSEDSFARYAIFVESTVADGDEAIVTCSEPLSTSGWLKSKVRRAADGAFSAFATGLTLASVITDVGECVLVLTILVDGEDLEGRVDDDDRGTCLDAGDALHLECCVVAASLPKKHLSVKRYVLSPHFSTIFIFLSICLNG
jgi:hypothetical protein